MTCGLWVQDDGTPVAIYKDFGEMVAEVLNQGRAELLLGGDGEIETPKTSKVLDSISEVLNGLKEDCDMMNRVLWNVTPCGSCKNRRFRGT
jgi:hypothetical protein